MSKSDETDAGSLSDEKFAELIEEHRPYLSPKSLHQAIAAAAKETALESVKDFIIAVRCCGFIRSHGTETRVLDMIDQRLDTLMGKEPEDYDRG